MDLKLIDTETLDKVTNDLAEIKKFLERMSGNQTHKFGYISDDELCKLLGIDKRQSQYLRSSGKINFGKYGRKVFYLESDIQAFIAKHHK